jgi:hypothetical protein
MSFSEKIMDFNKQHRLISHVLFWLVLLFIQISSSSYHNSDQVSFTNNLIGDGTNLVAQIPAAYILAYFIVPRFFYSQRYAEAVLYFVLSGYVICVASRIEVIYVEEPLYGRKHNSDETITEILTDLFKLVYVYFFRIFSVAFIFTFLKLLKDQLVIQKRTLLAEKQKAETELKLLKTQLNPHFLFNTLNNIYTLSLTSSPAAPASIARLADILDHILYGCNQIFVPLSSEIRLLNNYIGLEKLRYDDRLKINFESNIGHEINIAPLILLSLAENAFKHGAGDDAGAPEIDIYLCVGDDVFTFKISNSVAGPKSEAGDSPIGGIGLKNLKQQLQLIYGNDFSLETNRNANKFDVILTIQLTPEKTLHEKDQVFIG